MTADPLGALVTLGSSQLQERSRLHRADVWVPPNGTILRAIIESEAGLRSDELAKILLQDTAELVGYRKSGVFQRGG